MDYILRGINLQMVHLDFVNKVFCFQFPYQHLYILPFHHHGNISNFIHISLNVIIAPSIHVRQIPIGCLKSWECHFLLHLATDHFLEDNQDLVFRQDRMPPFSQTVF